MVWCSLRLRQSTKLLALSIKEYASSLLHSVEWKLHGIGMIPMENLSNRLKLQILKAVSRSLDRRL